MKTYVVVAAPHPAPMAIFPFACSPRVVLHQLPDLPVIPSTLYPTLTRCIATPMSRLIPDGFLTVRQAAERLAVGMYSGVPDRAVVQEARELGLDVADGAALDDAVSEIWAAVDKSVLNLFLTGARRRAPVKCSSQMSQGIPLFRSPRGGDLSFLLPTNPYPRQFIRRLVRDLSA